MDVADRIRRSFRDHGERPAIAFREHWVSWGEVGGFADRLEALLADAGVAPGARIGLVARNRGSHAAAMLALLAQRRSVSLIHPFLPAAMLAEEVERLGAAALIADAEDWPAIALGCGKAGSAGIALRERPFLPMAVPGLERATIADATEGGGLIEILSSGTTGPPKRLPLPLHVLQRAVDSAPAGEGQSGPPPQINVWPLSGVGGLSLLAASGAQAAPLVLIEKFSAEALADAVRRHRPPMLGLPPAAIRMTLDAAVPREHLASVTAIYGGSATLDPDIQDRFERHYGIPIYWGLGASEFCGTIVRWTPAMRRAVGDAKRGSVGLPMEGVALRVVDPDDGSLVEDGREGLMQVHCPVIHPHWVSTTDLIRIDGDGYVYHLGRHDGAIVRGGFKIMPERVADALRDHEAVRDAAVVGLPDERLEMVPAAMVELHGGARTDEAGLLAHLRERLPSTHIPVRIAIVDELPRTPSLKVSLAAVRAAMEGKPAN
ncbi:MULTISPECIES: class I adenylate-forming enzyme family protein [unclassified Sphingomonas]|uniref:class I adenylate-forming enzyme family protein n=1 Tax=unclassified Sphingomonas TaxID=196159 RepID=UPI0006F456CC|nr:MULTISPECIES: fatty acid--CoA ligase family protein [unclassified Sphingomonas]KQX17609.1 AMP-dependent synthetase [Sphingomonas sp. Root1294]KQY70535.1 AMP-dependent synthetase [Sphingomonas sp. Root50]KRB91978.1 AMP-dependent synthetase [Sphingomonas sp. Root720]